jgi:hypothetical protein
MAFISRRSDSWGAEVRRKEGGPIVFSKSQTFPTKALARRFAQPLKEKVRKDGPAAIAGAHITVGESKQPPGIPAETQTTGIINP